MGGALAGAVDCDGANDDDSETAGFVGDALAASPLCATGGALTIGADVSLERGDVAAGLEPVEAVSAAGGATASLVCVAGADGADLNSESRN